MKGNSGGGNVGGLTVMVIFTVLCLTIFSALSLSGARADMRLCDQTMSQAQKYYEADGQAEAKLRDIDLALQNAYDASSGEADFWDKASAALGSGFDADTKCLSFQIPINDSMELRVNLQLTAEPSYSILEWNSAATVEYVPDDSISVWAGE